MSDDKKKLIIVAVIVLVAALAIGALTMKKKEPTAGERIGDAITELEKGVNNAVDQAKE